MDAITVNKTSLAKHAVLGALLGAVLMCGLIVVRYLMDNTIKDEEDVRKLTTYNVLAEIPEYKDEDENGEGRGHAQTAD